jgi:2-succinyl-6-hydroxy-2,4-cyclohexadiene-1-carboxylate synthase
MNAIGVAGSSSAGPSSAAARHLLPTGEGRIRLWLFHGFTGGTHSFDHLLPLLGEAFFVCVPSMPGHGDAANPTNFVEAARSLAKEIEPGDVLAGYSMGARLALGAVLLGGARPRRLILESGTAGLQRSHERALRVREDETLAQQLERDGLDAFITEWEARPLFAGLRALDPTQQQALARRRRDHRVDGLASALRVLGTGAQPNLWPGLARLPVPLLCLTGARDEKFTALGAAMSTAAPLGYHHALDCGHAPHLERAKEWTAALHDFSTTAQEAA